MKIFAIITSLVIILSNNVLAATGDIIYQCDFSGGIPSDPKSVVSACTNTAIARPTVFNSGTQHTTSIPQNGGWNNGSYLSVAHLNSITSDSTDMMFMAYPSKTGLKEWTVTYYEKFDSWPITTPNIKSSRVYHSNAGGYYGALIGVHMNYSGKSMYLSPWETADVTVQTDVINQGIISGTRYGGTDLTGATLLCNGINVWGGPCVNKTYPGKYKFPGRPAGDSDILSFAWTTDNGVTSGYGTSWHKIRLYTKLPSSDTAFDGAITMWIDEKLAFTATNVKSSSAGMALIGYPGAGGATLTYVKFYPSDDAKSPFVHSYDDIIIYEGYVPPTLAPKAPSNLQVTPKP